MQIQSLRPTEQRIDASDQSPEPPLPWACLPLLEPLLRARQILDPHKAVVPLLNAASKIIGGNRGEIKGKSGVRGL
jgi:hypothetical protein